MAIGSIQGQLEKYPNLKVVWVDAHVDLNNHETTPSRNIHGMPLGFLTGLVPQHRVAGFDWLEPKLLKENIIWLGLREVDEGEAQMLKNMGLKYYTALDVERYGLNNILDFILNHFGNNPIHLSYDIDAIDPLWAEATGTKVKGGLTYREGVFVAEKMASSGKLVGLDLVEVNPDLETKFTDGHSDTAILAKEIILTTLGLKKV